MMVNKIIKVVYLYFNFEPPVFLGNSQGPLCTKAYTETHIFPTCEKLSCPDKNRVGLVDENKTHVTALLCVTYNLGK